MKWADPDELSPEDFAEWFLRAPTERQVEDYERRATKGQVDKERAARRADWRARHPEATCRDHIADLLAEMEATALVGDLKQRAGEAA